MLKYLYAGLALFMLIISIFEPTRVQSTLDIIYSGLLVLMAQNSMNTELLLAKNSN